MISIRTRVSYPPAPYVPSAFGLPFVWRPMRTPRGFYHMVWMPPTSVQSIKEAVADFYGLDPVALDSATTKREVALPRQIAMWLVRSRTSLSYPQIGRYFGGRDHTTVLYAARKIERMIEAGGPIREDVAVIRSVLDPSFDRATMSAVPSFHTADRLAGR